MLCAAQLIVGRVPHQNPSSQRNEKVAIMNNKWLLVFFGMATFYFGLQSLRVLPTLLRLCAALWSGKVKWPGPIIHDPDPKVSLRRQRLGWPHEHLFSTFLWHTSVVMATFAGSIISFIGFSQSLFAIRVNWVWCFWVLTIIAYVGARLSSNRAVYNMAQVNTLLSDLASGVEPRQVHVQSAEAEYAIEHPLIGHQAPRSDADRALNLYREALTHLHVGNRMMANMLSQQAMSIDPSLHKRVRGILSNMAQGCSPTDAGPVYYWLGIHSENLDDFQQAATWYERAAGAFEQLGYEKRQGRARCNLGTVQLKLGNYTLAMKEFEKAIALNPSDGIAHFNIGMMYYRISSPGEEKHERALDSFADAIAADPEAYGPVIASRMRSYAYTWKEDLEKVSQRVASTKRSDRMKTYRNEKLGFEIDIPEEWLLAPIPDEGPKDFFQFGCPNEAFNFEIGPLIPERLLEYTELEFRLYAQNKGYTDLEFGRITVGGREHVWARYHIQDAMRSRWNKKYVIVFGGTEYTITATCDDPQWFAHREKDWDAIVASFRLLESRKQAADEQSARRRQIAGSLYDEAYQDVAEGRYEEARAKLEKCVLENPDHTLAHKELAVVLRQLGDVQGALDHRWEVKRLDPSDMLNRGNIPALLVVLGARDEALQEIEELLEMQPNNPEFQALKASLVDHPSGLTYPQHYAEESQQQRGEKRRLRLKFSSLEDGKSTTLMRLTYQWDRTLSRQEAKRLDLRARAYIACAIYDAAISAGLFCQASENSHGRRPAWLVEGEGIPISLTNAAFDFLDSTCLMEIGPIMIKVSTSHGGETFWPKLLTGFKNRFSDITV
jgi:tetratricopeptide (TPR) repeat protein